MHFRMLSYSCIIKAEDKTGIEMGKGERGKGRGRRERGGREGGGTLKEIKGK